MQWVKKYAVTTVFFVLLYPVPFSTWAQGDDLETARLAFDRGQNHFEAGNYADAVSAFRESLAAFPHFRTLFNIALCEEKLGNLDQAITMYKQYVNWPAEVPNREEVSAKITELEQQQSASLSGSDEPVPTGPESTAQPPALDTSVNRDERNWAIPGWIALSVGLASAATGSGLLIAAGQKSAEMKELHQFEADKHAELPTTGRRLEVAGWVVGSVGLALMVGGTTLLLISRREKKNEPKSSFSMMPSRNGLRLTASWRF